MHVGGNCPGGLNILHLGVLEEIGVPHLLPSCLSPLAAKDSSPLDLPAELVI